jgi:hypothetical protein
MCGREFWIKSIERIDTPDWEPAPLQFIFPDRADDTWTGNPVITFKTRTAVHFKTGYEQDKSVTELPYWGSASNYD